MSRPARLETSRAGGISEMNWLARYAIYCGITPLPGKTLAQTIRARFPLAAWRLVCRSRREDFLHILRHRHFTLDDLVTYAARIHADGWKVAPPGVVLAYLIRQSHLYFDKPPAMPSHQADLDFLWVAGHAPRVTWAEMALVGTWMNRTRSHLHRTQQWSKLVASARRWRTESELTAARFGDTAWYFYCHRLSWWDHEIVPLDTGVEVWREGVAMSTCLYRLRQECQRNGGSRFFSIRRNGRRFATLELVFEPPTRSSRGLEALYGRWRFQDCRLRFNKLPDGHLQSMCRLFATQYTVWSRRPGRAMPENFASRIKPARRIDGATI